MGIYANFWKAWNVSAVLFAWKAAPALAAVGISKPCGVTLAYLMTQGKYVHL
jgi:hypothetical protein